MFVIREELKWKNYIMVDMKREKHNWKENYMALRFLLVGSAAYNKNIKAIMEEENNEAS